MPLRAVPDGDDRHLLRLEIVQQARLLAEVADNDHRIAMTRLQHSRKRDGFIRLSLRVTEHQRIAVLLGRARENAHDNPEKGIGEVADDHAQQHRPRPTQPARVRIGPVAMRQRR